MQSPLSGIRELEQITNFLSTTSIEFSKLNRVHKLASIYILEKRPSELSHFIEFIAKEYESQGQHIEQEILMQLLLDISSDQHNILP